MSNGCVERCSLDIELKERRQVDVEVTQEVHPEAPTKHSELQGLGFEESGHIGFASSKQLSLLKDESEKSYGVKMKFNTDTHEISLINAKGAVLSVIDLPTEQLIKDVSFNPETNVLTVTWENGQVIEIPLGGLIKTYKADEATLTLEGNVFKIKRSWLDQLNKLINSKVDKVAGKGLSTNDFTNEDKSKLASLNNYDDTQIKKDLENKVDKVEGKGLSTNDFTTPEKEKLAGLENYNDAEIKNQISLLEQDKVDLKTYATGAGGIEQIDAATILDNYKEYEGAIIQFYANEELPAHLVSYGFVMTDLDRVTKVLIEIDRNGIIRKWTKEANYSIYSNLEEKITALENAILSMNAREVNINYTRLDNHTLELIPQQVAQLKGLRVWVDYEYGKHPKRNLLNQGQDIRFTDKSNSKYPIGIPLANPDNFAALLLLQFKKDENILEIASSDDSGLVPTSTKIIDVKGLR